jgi:hypothetical protein
LLHSVTVVVDYMIIRFGKWRVIIITFQ